MTKTRNFSLQQHGQYKIHSIYIKEMNSHVFVLNADSIVDDIKSFADKMPVDRYQKMLKFRNESDQKLMVACEVLFAYGLEVAFPNIVQPIIRKVDQAGKPYIASVPNIYFNMSHAGKYAVCAFSEKPLGVDIEYIKPIDLSIAEHYFCEEEYQDIMERELGEQIKRFYQYWVLKESFTKAVGLGLSIPLNKFCFSQAKNSEMLDVQQEIDDKFYLADQFEFMEESYEMAICIQKKRHESTMNFTMQENR